MFFVKKVKKGDRLLFLKKVKKGDRLLFLYELSSGCRGLIYQTRKRRDYPFSLRKSSRSLFFIDSLKGGQSG
jgi:hypothetical protein